MPNNSSTPKYYGKNYTISSGKSRHFSFVCKLSYAASIAMMMMMMTIMVLVLMEICIAYWRARLQAELYTLFTYQQRFPFFSSCIMFRFRFIIQIKMMYFHGSHFVFVVTILT